MDDINLSDYDGFFNQTTEAPTACPAEMGEDAFEQPTPYNQSRQMMDDYQTPTPKHESQAPDITHSTPEIPDTQESQLLSQNAMTSPQYSRATFFNPSNNMDTPPAPKSSFFNPATTVSHISTRRSVSGSPSDLDVDLQAFVKNEDAEYDQEDMHQPITPYREPVQSHPMFTTPLRSFRARHPSSPASHNEVIPASHHTPKKQKTRFQPATVESGSDDDQAPKKQKVNFQQASVLESDSEYDQTPKRQMSNARQASADSDNDDEISIITLAEASKAAKSRWAEPRTVVDIEDEPQIIKHEPWSVSPVPNSLSNTATRLSNKPSEDSVVARQRARLNKTKAREESPFETSRSRRPSGYETPHVMNPRKRRLSGHYNVPEDPAEVNAAMRAGSAEDDSWMHEEPEEDWEEEIHQLQIRVDMLARREKNGKISEGEVYELVGLRKKLILQKKLLRCAQGSPSRLPKEPSLFVPKDREEILRDRRCDQQARKSASNPSPESDSDDDDGNSASPAGSDEAFARMLQAELEGDGLDGPPTEKELTKGKKPRRKVAKNARELVARQQQELREKERAKAQKAKARGVKAGGRKSTPRGKTASKKAKTRVKGGKGAVNNQPKSYPNRRSGIDEIGQIFINDLMNNDPIAERLQNPIFDYGSEPEILGNHTKTTQLQRLLANIPEGTSAKDAKSDKAKLKQAAASFGFAKVKAVGGKWLIKGMRSTLYHHQLLGAQWMIQRELNDEPPYGGLLADGMGLGKTVQTLACMVGNPPSDKDRIRGVKATLIVVPSSVIDQWLDEIRNHVEVKCFPKIMRYKASAKIPIEVLRDIDIVVCSYQEVMRQFPFPDHGGREFIEREGYKKWWKKASKSMGDLFGVVWLRVVLDEAHAIKNNSARTSLACQNLRSIYRWCLTGTPLLNRLEELFPYLRFLKAHYSMDCTTFQRYFCDPHANDCHNRIATLLSYTMMRRTMKTTILNRAIITLPPPHPEIRFIRFSDEERVIYRITENRFRTNLNAYFAAGTADRAYTIFLVQLLRLRQCTSHPFMLERTIKESWTSSDVKELRTCLNALGKSNVPFYEQSQVWATKNDEERQAARERGEDVLDGVTMPFGVGKYGHQFEMGKALKTLSEKDLYSRITCGLCSDLPTRPMMTDCSHIFCKECITSYMHRAATTGDNEFLTCPSCEKIFVSCTAYKGLELGDEESMDSESQDPTESVSEHSSKRGKHGKNANKHGIRGSKGCDMLDFEPNVKDSKWVVIYVQFRLLATIIGRICESEGWGFLYLTGDSSLEHRSKVAKQFRDNPDVKILIAGLKCGGLGLNFPWANRCISLDLWWNHAVEQQAFGRIFRIGQKKETYMTRIIVKNSVDMRLLTMQMHKLKACDKAMDSGEEKEKPTLSLRELAELFGFLRTDEDGKILEIVPDYVDED